MQVFVFYRILFNLLQQLMVKEFELDASQITPDANLYEDLDLDSIDAVDLVVKLREITGKKIEQQATYRYDETESGLRKTENGPLGASHITLLRLINSKDLEVLVQIGGIDAVLPECLMVARQHAAI